MKKTRLPEWTTISEKRDPPKDRAAFLRRSARAFAFVVRSARFIPEKSIGLRFSPPIKLAFAAVCVTLVSASNNFSFIKVVGAILLAFLASLDARKLRRILVVPTEACFASIVILLPAFFWGQTRAFFTVPLKTFMTTTILSVLAQSMNWNRFACALKSFGAPNSIVFIFDLTLKYVVVLSEKCLETIDAVILRSVGRNRRKARSLGGIAGLTFLRAQDASRDQFDAMKCRCFSGVYRRYRAPLRRDDYIGIALIVALIAVFVYFESVV